MEMVVRAQREANNISNNSNNNNSNKILSKTYPFLRK